MSDIPLVSLNYNKSSGFQFKFELDLAWMRMRSRNQIVECKNRFRKLQSFFLRNPSPKLNEAFGRRSKWRKCFANEINCLGKKYNFSIFLTFTFFKKIFLIFPLSLHWPVRSLLTLFFSISIVFSFSISWLSYSAYNFLFLYLSLSFSLSFSHRPNSLKSIIYSFGFLILFGLGID